MFILILISYEQNYALTIMDYIDFRLALVDSLLLSDMLVQKTIIPYLTNLSPNEPDWYKISYPYFWHPWKGIIVTINIYLMVAISAERFRAVCYPLSRRHVSIKLKTYTLSIRISSYNT